jgi:hypothetical protein
MKRLNCLLTSGLVLWTSLFSAGAAPPARGLLREVWEGIGGTDLGSLTNSPAWPNNPTSTNYVTDLFEAPTDVLDNYGQRLHGYIVPPLTGNYTFWLASDDNGALFLSTDENPANIRLVASVPEWTSSREWGKYPQQQSAPILLTAGRPYYVAALMKEGGGGDNLAVRWLMPDGTDQAPIVATNLVPYGVSFGPPVIAVQPTNTTVVEGQLARFRIEMAAVGFYHYRWLRNGGALLGADGPELVYGPVTLADHNARFRCVVTNELGSATSDEAVLTVLPDTTPPALLGARNLGTNQVEVTYSEPVAAPSATTPANYRLDGGVTISNAAFGATPDVVILTTSPLTLGVTYTLTVNHVKDRAQNANTIPPNSTARFTPVEYLPWDIGNPPLAGAAQPVPGGVDVSGAGDIGGTSDRLQFAWKPLTGDFDLRARLDGVTVSDPFLHAGLMARETTDANARFAAALASSMQLGCFFEARATAGGATTTAAPRGGFRANYPQTWLRLRRQGQTLTGFAGVDGQTWVQLGTQTFSGLSNTLYLGLAVASGNTNSLATARFRELGPAVNPVTVPALAFPCEPLGPSSRATGMIFSEIMYHPAPRADGRNLEFVELYNARSVFEDLSGWRLSGDIAFTFPEGFILQAGELVVVAAAPEDVKAVYGLTNVLGPYTGSLPNDAGRVRLRNNLDAIRLEVNYSDQPPWPAAADGAGHSLVLARPSYGEDDPRAWAASELRGGSPGTPDAWRPTPLSAVVLNEILAHTDDPVLDFVELFNTGAVEVDLSGCILTDDPATNRFRIPAGTRLPARGFLAFDQSQLGFALDSAGETVYLLDPEAARVLDAVRFGPQENGVALGRTPDGAPGWRRLLLPTPGSANTPRRIEPVVINEIMYHPISEDDADEYVELHNVGLTPVDLSGWRFVDGIDFEIPAGTTLPPGGYLVVAADAARLRANYPQLNTANTVGNFSGRLANDGERLALAKPDQLVRTNANGQVTTNTIYITVDEVRYRDGGRWGRWSDGGGSSLERIDPRADPLQPMNWADSDETQKAPWTTVEFTGRLDNGNTSFPANRLRISMLGPGECLVDDVEFFRVGSTNVVRNGGFEEGTLAAPTYWTRTGNHSRSTIDTTGAFSGSRCLHVRAQGDGDTGINSIRNTLATSVAQNQNATIRAKVRWLAGWPEVLFRAQGNWIEFPARMAIPKNLGTPGQVNSRRAANAGPAVSDVTHSPAVPQANEPVVVTCRVSDPDGIGQVRLRYRVDPASTYTTLVMRDDGSSGDAVAGDGVWSAQLTGRAAGNLVAFRVEASDAAASPATSVFPSGEFTEASPGQECLIRWGDPVPFGTFAHYHLWNTQATEQSRTAGLDNTYRDATLVYNTDRVLYNVGFRDKASPWHGGRGDFAVQVPKDDPLLGTDERIFASTGNAGNEPTAIRSQLAAWLHQQQGVPYLHAHYLRLYRNGNMPYNVMEDLEQPDHAYAERWFPDGGAGDLYKVAMWFEFQDDNSQFNAVSATLERFLSGSALKLARYRWTFQRRSNDGTATNYATIFDLVNAANVTGTGYVDGLLTIADMDQWMRTFSCGWIMGDWDMWSYRVGQNMFLYKQPGLRSVLMRWDIDFTFGLGDGATTALWGGQDPVVNRMYDNPAFRRMLWRAYLDAVNGPLLPERFQPQIDARRSVLLKNGITGLSSPSTITSYINSRRGYITNQIRLNDATNFVITTNGGQDYTSTTATTALTGRAPFAVATIEVNGVPYPVTWTDQRSFRLTVPLTQRTNVLALVGKDRRGNPVPGASSSITVTYTGELERPQDFVVLNEVQYNADQPGGDFLELHNRSTTTPFDLSGWRLDGVGYTFPPGAILPPGGFLVLAQDRQAFANLYGQTIPVFDEYPGTLDNGGESLALVRPGASPDQDTVISDVRYDDRLPWPPAADGLGPSLQLLDPALGAWRVGNWTATATNDVNRVTPGRANAARQTLPAFPPVWINEVQPNNLTGPTDASGRHEPWIELYNAGDTAVDLSAFYLTDTYTNLTRWQFPAGTVIGPRQFLRVWADGEPGQSAPGAPHTNFRLAPDTGAVALVRLQGSPAQPAVMDYLDYVLLAADRSYGSYPDGEPRKRRPFHRVTPGAPNDPTMPAIQVTLNEFMAANTTLPDPADGDFDDWFELHNAGNAPVDLSGYTLTDELANPAKYLIPPGSIVPPGGFLLVWADEEGNQTQPGGPLHANFKLSAAGEALGLFAPDGSLVDGFTFGAQTNDVSQGRYPDSGPLPLVTLDRPTPGAPNDLVGGNRPPVLDPIADRTAPELSPLRFTVTASDPDAGQQLTFSLGADAPAGASLEPDTGVFAWTPAEAQGPGEYTFTVRVTDNGTPPRAASRTVTITVSEVNAPPVLDPIADQVADEGFLLAVPLAATDPDLPPQRLTFSLEPGAPEGADIDPEGPALVWTPAEAQGPGVYPITVRVTDDGTPPLSHTRTFRVTVNEVNNPPEMAFIPPQTVEEMDQFTLRLEARDPDAANSPITFSLVRAPAGATLDPLTGLITWPTTEDDGPGNFIFEVRATETLPPHLSTTRVFGVEVLERNQAPELAPLADRQVRAGEILQFTAVATDADRPAQRLTFSLGPGAPVGAVIDPDTGVFTWRAGDDEAGAVYPVTVRVTDNDLRHPLTAARTFAITVLGVPRVVINEIMYSPPAPGAEFVELHNVSTNRTWDLSGWLLTGARYLFPAGTRLEPGGYLVVARNLTAFNSTYGSPTNVLGNYVNELSPDGGVIALYRAATPDPEALVDRVAFRSTPPWPAAAGTGQASLQLIDPRQDNARVANWTAVVQQTTNAPRNLVPIDATWRYWQAAEDPAPGWTNLNYNDSSWPGGKALLYVENAALPAPKNTPLTLGQMSYLFRHTFTFTGNPAGATLSLRPVIDDGAVFYLNGQPIFWLGMTEGVLPDRGDTALRTVSDAAYEGPFDVPVDNLRAGTNVLAVEVHQTNPTSSDIVMGVSVDVIELRREGYTPGYVNSVRGTLEPFPNLWINEVQPVNRTGPRDNAGEADPWLELAHLGAAPLPLAGWYLSDNFSNLTRWAFPAGATLAPGEYKVVWADAQAGQTTGPHWHTLFRLSAPNGVVVLARLQDGQPAVVDFLEYTGLSADQAFGYPEPRGEDTLPQVLATPTPGAANTAAPPPAPQLLGLSVSPTGQVTLRWSTQPGRTYRVEATAALASGVWRNAGQLTATGTEAVLTDTGVGGARTQFYRVVWVP